MLSHGNGSLKNKLKSFAINEVVFGEINDFMVNFLKGFMYAFNGLMVFLRRERNGRIQLLIAIVTLTLAWLLRVSAIEWIILCGCIANVLAFEMINSAVEKLCNLVHPGYNPAIKVIKDISAGAVLWVSIFSAVIGLIIFLPRLLHLLK